MELLDTKIERIGFIFYGKFSEGLFQEWLKIITILASKSDLQNELLFQVGFSVYKLIEVEKQQFRLVSIDYEANPFKDFTEDLTVALWIQSEQASLTKELQINPSEIRFDDKILIAKGSSRMSMPICKDKILKVRETQAGLWATKGKIMKTLLAFTLLNY